MPKSLLVLTLLSSLALVGCETVKGMGRDLQNAGHAIDRAVN